MSAIDPSRRFHNLAEVRSWSNRTRPPGLDRQKPAESSAPRVEEAFLVEMLDIGPRIADENEGGLS
jgi:hypothetical protein